MMRLNCLIMLSLTLFLSPFGWGKDNTLNKQKIGVAFRCKESTCIDFGVYNEYGEPFFELSDAKYNVTLFESSYKGTFIALYEVSSSGSRLQIISSDTGKSIMIIEGLFPSNWSPIDPNILWTRSEDNTLTKLNVITGQKTQYWLNGTPITSVEEFLLSEHWLVTTRNRVTCDVCQDNLYLVTLPISKQQVCNSCETQIIYLDGENIHKIASETQDKDIQYSWLTENTIIYTIPSFSDSNTTAYTFEVKSGNKTSILSDVLSLNNLHKNILIFQANNNFIVTYVLQDKSSLIEICTGLLLTKDEPFEISSTLDDQLILLKPAIESDTNVIIIDMLNRKCDKFNIYSTNSGSWSNTQDDLLYISSVDNRVHLYHYITKVDEVIFNMQRFLQPLSAKFINSPYEGK